MRPSTLLRRSLSYYWRTNLAVVAGVAVAVAVLAGALVVGDSVRASLRSLFLQRLGRADTVVSSANFFREQLSDEIRTHADFAPSGLEEACPLVVLEASVATEEGGRRAAGVQVYGVDERFWKFHGRDGANAPRGREILLSESLAAELEAKAGEAVLLRVRKPSAIPADSLHGRKEETGRTVRLTMREALGAAQLGEFSLRPQQGSVRAAFVPLRLLQQDLEQDGRVNAILLSRRGGDADASEASAASRVGAVEKVLRERVALEDLGIKLRALAESNSVAVETESSVVSDDLAGSAREAATSEGLHVTSLLSYLANTIEVNGREVPYSLVTAIDEESFARLAESATETAAATDGASAGPPILINEWTARDLGAKAGDALTLEYYLWRDDGRLTTERARLRVAGVIPMKGLAADRDLVPRYPGITESQSLSDWDPPFPIDLRRVRDQDETYWDEYRTTPKAFVPLAEGQRLWQTRYGRITSLRVAPAENSNATPDANGTLEAYARGLRERVDPARMSFAVVAARAEGVAASRGATDFGEYFLYFSFFLVVSALLLTVLFFRLGVEQRLREIGLLRAFGFDAARVRRLFLGEAAVLSVVGSVAGIAGALLYGWLMMAALRTWWVGAVGTTMLELHVSPASLAAGALGGIVAALACIVWTLRRLAPASPRSLLAGVWEAGRKKGKGKKGETAAARGLPTR
ncbi:MAG TPA: ABC transporter permease, partial [Pyrinomonadaceae bacterium]|nr:ABC transporter permease [Pyrinomonadaceae bacterium]